MATRKTTKRASDGGVRTRETTPKKPSPRSKQAPSTGVREGMRAPTEELADQSGRLFSWKALKGKAFVLYFYPRDKTSGCTREAGDFRDRLSEFTRARVEVLGVSPDSVESHASFADQEGLNFTLLSDPDHRLAEAYGTWIKKKNYGREYMGIDRSTFVVDARGIVRKVFRGVRVPGHVDRVLEAIGEL